MKKKIIISAVIIAVLSGAFFFAEKPPENIVQNSDTEQSSAVEQTSSVEVSNKEQTSVIAESAEPESSAAEEISELSQESSQELSVVSVSEEVQVQSSQPRQVSEIPVQSSIEMAQQSSMAESSVMAESISEPEPSVIAESSAEEISEVSESKTKCTLSISCHTLLNHLDRVKKNKLSVIPSDGWILTEISTDFEEGESVFDVTKRVCMENKIPFEFTLTPVYNTAYIEGINNIYEFDCGSTSGWLYKVNGEFLGYGCSDCKLKDSDKIEWVYTCNLGKDVGNEYSG